MGPDAPIELIGAAAARDPVVTCLPIPKAFGLFDDEGIRLDRTGILVRWEVERFVATVLVLKHDRELGMLEGPVRLAIARAGGILINQGQQSLAARFNGPARSLRASLEIIGLFGGAGLNVRAGTHTGEVDLAEANAMSGAWWP